MAQDIDKKPRRMPDFVKEAVVTKAAEKVAPAAAPAAKVTIPKVPAQVGWAKLEAKLETEAAAK